MNAMNAYQRRFVDEVVKCKQNMIYIELDKETLDRIDAFVRKIVAKKLGEMHHQIDNLSEYKRFHTGIMGECAIEKFFNCQFIDWSIGDSRQYHKADLRKLGINVGIKTVEMYKFPIVFKREDYPELICIKRNENTIILCGLAQVEILNRYQDDNLILDQNLRNRGTKTGFYGFEHLIKINSLEELRSLV